MNNVKRDSINQHLVEALRGAIVESESDIFLSRQLHAEIKLRLICMTDAELWELAKRTSCPPERPVESTYKSHKQRVKELKATSSEWMKDLSYIPITNSRE